MWLVRCEYFIKEPSQKCQFSVTLLEDYPRYHLFTGYPYPMMQQKLLFWRTPALKSDSVPILLSNNIYGAIPAGLQGFSVPVRLG